MTLIDSLYQIIVYGVVAVIVATIVLMLLRLLMNYADVNPFTKPAMLVRRLSDPLVNPVRSSLLGFGFDPKFAPLVTILLVILLGWFVLQLAESLLSTANGVYLSIERRKFIALIGFILFGALSIYELLIIIRIIFSWGRITYANRVMRFLVKATDPLLVPLRRIIPPLGIFDISALVALILIWLFKAAIRGTLLVGF
jgi:YggT family protein